MERLKKLYKDILIIIKKPVMSILPGQLAFSFVLTIIPLLALIALVASMFSISLDSITNFIKETFPTAVSGLLLSLINGRGFDFSVLIFLFSALLLASSGANSIITASDIIYDLPPQNFISKRIKAFIMTFVLLMLVAFLLVVLAFGDKILLLITSLPHISHIKGEIMSIYYLLKYPLSFILILFNIKIIYTMAPNKEIKSKSVTTGALFTTITWIIITQIYSFWINNVVHYDIFYGSISNIIILLMWMYFLAYAFVIGLVMNAGINIENKNKL